MIGDRAVQRVEIVDFAAQKGQIDGLLIVTMKQVSDGRGTIRELFRRSAFETIGVTDLGPFQQINLTETRRGAIRGMHAEEMTKLLAVADGEVFGAYVDLRADSATFGVVDTVALRPGTQVLVPSGVANGFQGISPVSQYAYCFDAEWQPGMAGVACHPLDPDLGIEWPIEIDRDDVSQLSTKDRQSPSLAEVAKRLGVVIGEEPT